MKIRLWTAFALALGLGVLATSCSTDDICTDACVAWEETCGYSDYDFDICFDDCKDDGDWSWAYVGCVEDSDSCFSLELCQVLF